VTVSYDRPIKAPLKKGQEIGKLLVSAPEMPPQEFPLVAGKDVERLGALGRVGAAVGYLVFGSGSKKQ
jgi:D-alanyl-D-alanine carboxypeptidase (penicillin-binding protein 5/6)